MHPASMSLVTTCFTRQLRAHMLFMLKFHSCSGGISRLTDARNSAPLRDGVKQVLRSRTTASHLTLPEDGLWQIDRPRQPSTPQNPGKLVTTS